MGKKTSRITFRVEQHVLEALENLADAEDVSVGYLAREIVKRSVRARGTVTNKIKADSNVFIYE